MLSNIFIFNSFDYTLIIDLGIVSVLLLLSTCFKRIKFFKKFLIPNSVIAGVLGFAILSILRIFFDDIPVLQWQNMLNIMTFMLVIGFIALSFKNTRKLKNERVVNSGAFIVSTYVFQGIVGLLIGALCIVTFFPDLFGGFGLLFPLGFGQGPQAGTIGGGWFEEQGAQTGSTIAAIGFLWASFAGVPLMNFMLRKRAKKQSAEAEVSRKQEGTISSAEVADAKKVADTDIDDSSDIPLASSMDRFTYQIAIIFVVYLITVFAVWGLTLLLPSMAATLWGFVFIFGAVFGILARILHNKLLKAKVIKKNYIDNYLLQRTSGIAFDFMVASSIISIDLGVLGEYLIPVLILTTLGGFATLFYIYFVGKKIYKNDAYENIAGMFGNCTGTVASGMALVKEMDPTFQTGAAKNLVLGGGVAIGFGFPLLIILNWFIDMIKAKTLAFGWIVLIATAVLLVYFSLLLLFIFWNNRRISKQENLQSQKDNTSK